MLDYFIIMSISNLLSNIKKPWANLFINKINIDSVLNNQVLVTDGSKNVISVPFSTFQGAPVTPFSVGAGQAFSSINVAIQAAVTAGYSDSNRTTVYIVPGTYTENIILAAGISLSSFNAQGCTVNGKMTCDVNGAIEIANITMNNTVDLVFDITGINSCNITFNNCVFNQFFTDYILECTNSQASLFFSNCNMFENIINDILNISQANSLFMKNCLIIGVNGAIILGNIPNLSIIQSNILACKVISNNTSNINVLFGCIVVFNDTLLGGSLITVTNGGQVGLIESVLVGGTPGDFACGGDANPANTLLKYNTGVLPPLSTVINGISNIISLSTL